MTQPFYTAQTDVAVGSRGKASDINNLDSAVEQAFKNVNSFGIDSGTSSAYVVTMDTDATAYYDGMVVSFAPDNTNTVQSPTINVNGLGAKSTASANQLSGVVEIGEIKTGHVYTFIYYASQNSFSLQGSARLNSIPGAIGGTTPAAGSFTTVSASSTVTGQSLIATTGGIRSRGGDNASATNFAAGEGALDSNSGGLANTAIGQDALTANTNGTGNTAVGRSCLNAMVSGQNNTAIGYFAAQTYTGSGLVAVGVSALSTNSSGTGCTAVGFESLKDNSIGNSNTAVGYTSASAYTGDGITAIGYQAAKGTTADGNTAIGYNALRVNSTGEFNTAVGYKALDASSTWNSSTALGYEAAVVSAAPENTAIGFKALWSTTSGINNTGVGANALNSNITGSNNVAIGNTAGPTATNLDNTIAIGNGVEPSASNQTVIGNSSATETVLRGQVKGGAGTGTGQPVMVGMLDVDTTSDGNTGLATDSPLRAKYALPANSLSGNNKGIRITHWGTGAANANTKTLTAFFGTTRLIEAASTTANALSWKIVVHVFRTGASAQVYQAELMIYGVAIEAHLITNGTCTETDSATIDIWAAGTSITTNDLVQKGRLIEFINQ